MGEQPPVCKKRGVYATRRWGPLRHTQAGAHELGAERQSVARTRATDGDATTRCDKTSPTRASDLRRRRRAHRSVELVIARGTPRLPRLDGRFRVGKLIGDEGASD